MICPYCKEMVMDGAVKCKHCGSEIGTLRQGMDVSGHELKKRLAEFKTLSKGRNRLAAALFALLLGGLGIHKFYLGKVGMGILYLIFCWTAIPSFIGFIEGILYITSTDEEFDRKYNG